MGYAAWANRPKSSTAPLLEKLVEAGAVLYCKTNVPRKYCLSYSGLARHKYYPAIFKVDLTD
jgi:Asp-tRNA(Asn)/Glu-tRNA(Gln) amidotransferase A subunit family amidase